MDEMISDILFSMLVQCMKVHNEERKYSHKYEWKADLLDLLQKENGTLSGSLATIAGKLGCAVSSLKNVLAELQNEGAIVVQSKRGRKKLVQQAGFPHIKTFEGTCMTISLFPQWQ